MSDYISREAAIADFEYCNQENSTWTPQRVKTLLMRITSADVVPVRHGRWGNKKGGFFEFAACSLCGEEAPTAGITPNYCPNCGAKMDLEDKHCNQVESDFCSYGQAPINSIPENQEERWLKTV